MHTYLLLRSRIRLQILGEFNEFFLPPLRDFADQFVCAVKLCLQWGSCDQIIRTAPITERPVEWPFCQIRVAVHFWRSRLKIAAAGCRAVSQLISTPSSWEINAEGR